MNKTFKALTVIFFIICVACGLSDAKEVKFELSLDRDNVGIGEATQLGLSFYGVQSMPAPDIGKIDGLEIRYVGPSTMMTVINGQVSSSVTHMYSVLPLKVGKFQIGPLSFKYKNDTYSSNMVFLDVGEEKIPTVKQEASAAEKLNLEDRIYVTLETGKSSAYVNELIPVTVKLYVNRLNVSDIQLPTFAQENFSKVEFREPKQYRENISGMTYEVLEFKTSIFGTKAGDYMLGPAKIKCNVVVKRRSPGSSFGAETAPDDFFRDSFFDDFFTRYEKHPVELKSKETHLIISPLPSEGRPADFMGAVGDYQFIFSAKPTNVKVGDPITVRMDINGTGNLNTVLIPKLDNVSGFRAYEPQVRTDDHHKSFNQVLIPETDNVSRIPSASFSYFDPDLKKYKTIIQGPIPITVEKGKEEAPSQVIGPAPGPVQTPEKENLARDIIYIKEMPGRWLKKNYQIYKKKGFFLLLVLPLLFLGSLYIMRLERERFARDSAYAGRIVATRSARKGLKALKRKLKPEEAPVFYELLFKVLQSYLGSRLNVPPAGITSDIADNLLSSKDIDMDILRKMRNLFEVCDMARFALAKIDSFRMKDDLKEFEDIINYFERKKI